jgi:Fur family peroxide stress response transcriptional regulator
MSPSRRIPDPDRVSEVDWAGVGLRRTLQREVVLGLVRTCYDHPTADWIHQEARRVIPDISLATVYRTLRLLKEKGLIFEFSGGPSPSRYDGTLHMHEHVRCVCCGAVADVDLPEIGDLRRHVSERTGFDLGRVPLLFQGLCSECAAKGRSRDVRDRALFAASHLGDAGDPAEKSRA